MVLTLNKVVYLCLKISEFAYIFFVFEYLPRQLALIKRLGRTIVGHNRPLTPRSVSSA